MPTKLCESDRTFYSFKLVPCHMPSLRPSTLSLLVVFASEWISTRRCLGNLDIQRVSKPNFRSRYLAFICK